MRISTALGWALGSIAFIVVAHVGMGVIGNAVHDGLQFGRVWK